MRLHWLENRSKDGYVTWGMPWSKGEVTRKDSFVLTDEQGAVLPVQSRPRAYWPDGSVKWTLHTAKAVGNEFVLQKGEVSPAGSIAAEGTKIMAGDLVVQFTEGCPVPEVTWQGTKRCLAGRLTAVISGKTYTGVAERIIVEEAGPLRAVVKVTGTHSGVLPFVLRYYIHYNEPDIRIVHTFLYDVDHDTQWIEALGMEFDAPIGGPLYNRHVKIGGENGGYLKESCALMDSWIPELPKAWYVTQISGGQMILNEEEEKLANQAMSTMTWWDNWKIVQDSAMHYRVLKNSGEGGCSDVEGPEGYRANGILAAAGLCVSRRDFWQKYPSGLEVSGMLGETATLKAWIWSPEVRPMDMRPYSMRRCFEAYYGQEDPEMGIAIGIGQTNEIHLRVFEGLIPSDEEMDRWAYETQNPSLLVADPVYYHDQRAFGTWSLPKYDTPARRVLEEQLETYFQYYKKEVEQRKWYGLWNYGDVMHTYDRVRHCWRYDMGGYAWDNTEMVPTMWLWYHFLRSGREEIFTMAEAMCRHCAEVDVHHIGPFAGLGVRHSVKHYGGSAKEARASMAGHHRFYYYLTGDERTGDIMDEVKDADFTILDKDPLRHYYQMDGTEGYPTHARTGPDWSSFCSNWLYQWEHYEDQHYKEKIYQGLAGIEAAPYRFVSGIDFGYDPHTGKMTYIGEHSSGSTVLALCMGEPQLYFEMEDVLDHPTWKEMMAQYGDFFFKTPEEKLAASNEAVAGKGWAEPLYATAMVAYAANANQDASLGREVWECFFTAMYKDKQTGDGQYMFGEVTERPGANTKDYAQWSLNLITALDLAEEYLPEEPIAEPVDKFLNWRK